jgi:hypothetical protein
MANFGIGDIVGYQKETKEWQICKIELIEGKHGEEYVEYTVKKVKGQDLGKKAVTDAENLIK